MAMKFTARMVLADLRGQFTTHTASWQEVSFPPWNKIRCFHLWWGPDKYGPVSLTTCAEVVSGTGPLKWLKSRPESGRDWLVGTDSARERRGHAAAVTAEKASASANLRCKENELETGQ